MTNELGSHLIWLSAASRNPSSLPNSQHPHSSHLPDNADIKRKTWRAGPQVSSIGTLRLFLDSAFQQGLVTRTQLRELQAYVDECHTRRPAVVGVAAGPPNPLLNASFSAVRSSPGVQSYRRPAHMETVVRGIYGDSLAPNHSLWHI